MGFTTGFTGGVTLTLSVAYLTVLAHQRNRQQQCGILRANTNVLRALALSDPVAAARLATPHAAVEAPADLSAAAAAQEFYYPSKPVPPLQPRSSFVEDLKSRWNAEVEGAVRKVQTTDWVEVREEAEDTLARLWGRAFGSDGSPEAATAAAKERVASVAAAGSRAVATAQAKAGEVAAAAKSVAGRAVEKSKAALTAESAAAPKQPSEVELALQKRYSKAEDERMKKSVTELLDERYKQKA